MNTPINPRTENTASERLDGKIDEVARALRHTRAFERHLYDRNGSTRDYVHRLVIELEDRLATLRSMRVSRCGEDC